MLESKKEAQIFDIIRNTIKTKCPEITVRVAGGFVRDKLLGLESHDIDIAVDKCSGTAFANFVLEYMNENNLSTSRVTTVEANTEANKNLESAILPILGVEVDFAQLRKESYNEESRNPEIEVGVTAEEDAMRRDLTINAIFYNLNTKSLEDYVNGISDLNNRIAKTPIDPIKTFLEDPLRIFRIIRFACKYDLEVTSEIISAARDERIKLALLKKISRERIWTEFSKFMSHNSFPRAIILMQLMGLRNLFLTPTPEQIKRIEERQKKYDNKKWTNGFGNWDMDQNSSYHNLNVWDHTLQALTYLSTLNLKDVMIASISLLFHDIGKCDACSMQVTEEGWHSYKEHELSSAIMVDEILKDLRAPNEIRTRVVSLVKNHMRLHQLPLNAKPGLRRIIRDVGREDWPNFVAMSKSDSMGKISQTLDAKYDKFNEYAIEYLNSLDEKSSEVKPPLNGNEIMELLGIKPGKTVGIIMNTLKEQLLIEPEMTKEKAIEFIKLYQIND